MLPVSVVRYKARDNGCSSSKVRYTPLSDSHDVDWWKCFASPLGSAPSRFHEPRDRRNHLVPAHQSRVLLELDFKLEKHTHISKNTRPLTPLASKSRVTSRHVRPKTASTGHSVLVAPSCR